MTTTWWLTEADLPLGRSGVRLSVEVVETLHDERSRFGHIQVLDTVFHGRMLVIDGIIQTTERDEFVYHETLVLPAALRHGAPTSALIIGGGDGGALRQALRLRSLTRAVQVEIDDTVTRVCRQHLPSVSGGAFDDPRAELVFADGARLLAETSERFDLIVLDLTDPTPGGPAEPLFAADFLRVARAALNPGGVLAMQCGSVTVQPAEVAGQLRRGRAVFTHVDLHTAVVPGYQLSTFGFLVAGDRPRPAADSATFARRWGNVAGACEYVSPEMYAASLAAPPYLRRVLGI
ncbi:polyamine aminopropyltransferase [Pilimelia columellifera]|uniref:Polyamine aminopropyltransferase n=1 Tax=Pilimelia columellifera subsp. columellifera TaxID=706583 RepID=A0ABP6AHK5_9ACTN